LAAGALAFAFAFAFATVALRKALVLRVTDG
jgi:hypothetical protein